MGTKYQISEDEYVRAFMLASRYSLMRIAIYVTIAVIYLMAIYFDTGNLYDWPLGAVAGVALFLVIFHRYILPYLARRAYRKYDAIHDPLSALVVELQTDGLYFSTPDASSKLKWEKMLKWRQNDEFVLIYIMPRLFHIIPKSLTEKGFDVMGLTVLLEEKIGKEK